MADIIMPAVPLICGCACGGTNMAKARISPENINPLSWFILKNIHESMMLLTGKNRCKGGVGRKKRRSSMEL
jgi:hypothetical protein